MGNVGAAGSDGRFVRSVPALSVMGTAAARQSMTCSSSSPPLADHLPTPPAPSSAEQGRHFLCDVTRGALFNRAPL